MDPEKRWEECHPIGSEHEEERSPFEAQREKEEKQALARARADEAARLKAERVAAVAGLDGVHQPHVIAERLGEVDLLDRGEELEGDCPVPDIVEHLDQVAITDEFDDL